MKSINLAKPFIDATKNVLSTFSKIQPVAGKPYRKTDHTACGDVSGIIGVTGEKNGSISITFSKKCAITIVKNMLGNDIEDILQDVQDAVGEISNVISGQARIGLAEMGINLQGSTPTVILGDGHTIKHVASGPILAIPFTSNAGDFTVEFCFEDMD